MKLRCPACNQIYIPDGEEYIIPLRGWQHSVCKACVVAYLKVRVKSGERLEIEDLMRIGQVRTKVKKSAEGE